MSNKKAYFQGGGGVNEPTPGKKKYKSDPAIVVQPRFKEPFYHNYDLYKVPGMEEVGPGVGWHDMQNHKSVQEFLDARRKRLQHRYVADDSWQLDSGERTKTKPKMAMRMAIFSKIIKTAEGDENDGPNFDYGDGAYTAMSEGKKMKSITDHKHKGPGAFFTDDNDIDFPIDDQVNHYDQMIYPEEDQYQIRREKGDKYDFPSDGSNPGPENLNISMTSPQIAGEHSYLPNPDFEGKSDNGSQLDFGRDYTEDADMKMSDETLENLTDKYLNPKENGLYGLPDGIDPQEDLDADKTVSDENPDYGTTNSGNTLYEDKWNI